MKTYSLQMCEKALTQIIMHHDYLFYATQNLECLDICNEIFSVTKFQSNCSLPQAQMRSEQYIAHTIQR